MKLSLIVAYGKHYQIGKNNQLLWHIPDDLAQFKRYTNGHHILMGRKTFESIGKPLPNRTSLILTHKPTSYEGAYTFGSFEHAVEFAKKNGEDELFIIGGAQVYALAWPYVNRLYVSEVDYHDEEADAFIDPIDFSQWILENQILFDEKVDSKGRKIPSWRFTLWNKQ